jgi:endonuclease YncB( thermonuclease family)
MVKTFIGWAFLLFPAALFAVNYGSIMLDKGNVLSVTDGQTFQVDIHQGQSVVGRNIEVRLRGVETPAIDGECEQESALAVDARNFVHKLLMCAETIVLRGIDRKRLTIGHAKNIPFVEHNAAVVHRKKCRWK